MTSSKALTGLKFEYGESQLAIQKLYAHNGSPRTIYQGGSQETGKFSKIGNMVRREDQGPRL